MASPALTSSDAFKTAPADPLPGALTSIQTSNLHLAARAERARCMKRLDAGVVFYILIDLGAFYPVKGPQVPPQAGSCLRAAILPSDWNASAKQLLSRKEGDAFNRVFLGTLNDLGQHDYLSIVAQEKFSKAFLGISNRIEQALRAQNVANCEWVKSVSWPGRRQQMADGGAFFELSLKPKDSNPGVADKTRQPDAAGLDEALARAKIALDAQFLGRALFERCHRTGPPAFETSALLSAADERELRGMLSSGPNRSPKSVRL